MAVIAVRSFPDRAGSSGGEDNDRAEREWTETFLAFTNSPVHTGVSVLLGAETFGLPVMFAPHPIDPGARVVRRSPRRTDEGTVWEIEVQYATRHQDPAQGSIPDPVDRPPEISFGFVKYQRPVERDFGIPASSATATDPAYPFRPPRAVVNSAGQPFDPPIEIDDSRPTLTVSRYEATFNPLLAIQYQDAVNSDTFYGAAPGIWKVTDISSRVTVENGEVVVRVSYSFEARREGWGRFIQDTGMGVLNANDEFEWHRDGSGATAAQPIPLNGIGRPLAKAKSTLAEAMDATQTTLKIQLADADGKKFPKVAVRVRAYNVLVDSEIIRVTNSDTATFTVIRAQDGTTAAAHAVDAKVQMEHYYIPFRVYQTLPFAPLALE